MANSKVSVLSFDGVGQFDSYGFVTHQDAAGFKL